MSITRDDVKIVDDDVKVILSEAIADYETRTDKVLQPAHIERSIIQTYAYREWLVRQGINEAFVQQFPQFATGIALDLCGEPMGCYRLENQAAVTTLRFSVSESHDDIVIPVGTQVSVSDELYFATTVAVKIAATAQYVDVEAIASVTGSQVNGWEVGRLKNLVTALDTDLAVTVTNIDETSGGIDTESDDDYRKRILLAPEAFTTCGTVGSYEYHTRSVSQYIADVHISTPQGGKVQIVLLTKNGVPTQSMVNRVQAYVSDEQRRTLCDTVMVLAAEEVPYTIEAELDIFNTANGSKVLSAAQTALREYLSSRTQQMGLDIVPLNIQAALKVDGVYNVRLISPVLTEISDDQWANCTAITVRQGESKDG